MMKPMSRFIRIHFLISPLLIIFVMQSPLKSEAFPNRDEPDSIYLFSYTTPKNNYHDGLHFAWSLDRKNWHLIGQDFSFLRCDYGRWGTEKRMIDPYLAQDAQGIWHCVWSVNEYDPVFAHATSVNLIDWGRQSYPQVPGATSVRHPMLIPIPEGGFKMLYQAQDKQTYQVSMDDFKHVETTTAPLSKKALNPYVSIDLPGGPVLGQLHRVAWKVVGKLLANQERRAFEQALNQERSADDPIRFANLKPLQDSLIIRGNEVKPISKQLTGVFFEDINYAADGGLYAELVQNRDFEYRLSDKEGRDPTWNSQHAWRLIGENSTLSIDSISPLHPNNPHYAILKTNAPGASLQNTGFDGISVNPETGYVFSFFSKQLEGKGGRLLVSLQDSLGHMLAQSTLPLGSKQWKKSTAVLYPNAAADGLRLVLQPLSAGHIALDMISLFPQQTFKNRPNGLRADLAQAIADIHPRFVRFPGGCVAHGDGLGNIYRWKNTIGPLEARVPQRNLWGYHQSAGLGYFEYFQFCEDIDAEPVPVLAAGVPCQNSSTGGAGQQGGIPMEEMDDYIQEILDLVEYANGDVHSPWGKKRAEAGHPEPFHLKYIGIGNEDLISDVFEERFMMIFQAMREKHPEITVIGTVGPAAEGTDYTEGWKIASRLQVPMVDEHYYQTPGWFIHHQDFYDRYDRSKSNVYLGEYAAHLPGRPNNLETALAEALYMTALERNGDVVSMASYAPLLAKEGHTQWNPNLIYFNNREVKPTVDYYVQQLYGQHAGDHYVAHQLKRSNTQEAVSKRIGISVVRDSESHDLIIKMVNLLPVPVTHSIDLKDIQLEGSKALKIQLTGTPTDRQVRPAQSTQTISNHFVEELPPYSFTLIRCSMQE